MAAQQLTCPGKSAEAPRGPSEEVLIDYLRGKALFQSWITARASDEANRLGDQMRDFLPAFLESERLVNDALRCGTFDWGSYARLAFEAPARRPPPEPPRNLPPRRKPQPTG